VPAAPPGFLRQALELHQRLDTLGRRLLQVLPDQGTVDVPLVCLDDGIRLEHRFGRFRIIGWDHDLKA
jgi:hypothetical protein